VKFKTIDDYCQESVDDKGNPTGYTLAYCIMSGKVGEPQRGDRCAFTGSYNPAPHSGKGGELLIVIRDVDRMSREAKKNARLAIIAALEAHRQRALLAV
jgi:hypothetical protein